MAYIFQEYSTSVLLTVEEKIQFGLKIKKFSNAEINKRTEEVIKIVGLEEFRNYYQGNSLRACFSE